MANIIKTKKEKEDFRSKVSRLFQSGNINFIFGSGASYPAISVAGNVEKEIQKAIDEGRGSDADGLIYDLLKGVQEPFTTYLLPPIPDNLKIQQRKELENNTPKSLAQYAEFIQRLESLLNERKSSLIPKQANVFTTNYDLFLEKASEGFPAIIFNDGFVRTPNIGGWHEFSSRSFFNSTFNKGNLYNYKVEVPTINFIKIHGSLSWMKSNERIYCSNQIKQDEAPIDKKKFNEKFSLILPRRDKFKETIMDRTYYDLLRIYANELDKENTLLVAFGFSFLDEHIRDITIRALKNPTLKLIVFAHDESASNSFKSIFDGYSNVDIYSSEGNDKIDFSTFNKALNEILNPPNEEGGGDED